MSKSTQLRWIAEVEARDVLAAARFERAASPSWGAAVGAAVADRVRSWLAPVEPAGCRPLQAQPALARRPVYRPVRPADFADNRYCRW